MQIHGEGLKKPRPLRETVMRSIQSVGDAEKEFEKAFHFLEAAEVMNGGQDIASVTQPTVTVVPVSSW